MPQGHKSGRKTIMTRLMPLGHNPSTRLMPQGHKVRVYGTLEERFKIKKRFN
jgi:hypothetical protein